MGVDEPMELEIANDKEITRTIRRPASSNCHQVIWEAFKIARRTFTLSRRRTNCAFVTALTHFASDADAAAVETLSGRAHFAHQSDERHEHSEKRLPQDGALTSASRRGD